MNVQKNEYMIEMSWGCPSEQYPLNGIFQFDQARALKDIGKNLVYVAVDMRSFRRWRKWGINHRRLDGIEVYEYNFPLGPLFKNLRYCLEKKCFEKVIKVIEKKYGLPECFHIHNCTIAVAAVDYCVRKNIPYIITEHSSPVKEGKERERRKQNVYQQAKCVVAVSNSLSAQLTDKYNINPIVIPNIVDLTQFEYRKPCMLHEKFRFISAARIDSGKGFDVLLKAFAKVVKEDPDCILEIMGDGPCLKEIKCLAKSLHVSDKVIFWGEYLRSDYFEELSHSDCFVLASRSETFGLVYIEAMACGIPVVATRCGGPEDFVNSSNGILVPVDNIDALRLGMLYMKQNIEKFVSNSIAAECRERFSPNKIAGKIEELLRETD